MGCRCDLLVYMKPAAHTTTTEATTMTTLTCTCDIDAICDGCIAARDAADAESVRVWGSLEAAETIARIRVDLDTARCGGPWAASVWG